MFILGAQGAKCRRNSLTLLALASAPTYPVTEARTAPYGDLPVVIVWMGNLSALGCFSDTWKDLLYQMTRERVFFLYPFLSFFLPSPLPPSLSPFFRLSLPPFLSLLFNRKGCTVLDTRKRACVSLWLNIGVWYRSQLFLLCPQMLN